MSTTTAKPQGFTPRTATRFLASHAARFGHKSKVKHKRDESLFSLLPPKEKDLTRVFTKAIAPALEALEGVGKVGINVIGMSREDIAAMIAKLDAKRWKWVVFEKGNVMILPRNESGEIPLSVEHITTVADAVNPGARVGFAALVRAV